MMAGMVLAAALFAIGLFGMMARRGILFQLLAMEIMLSGPAVAFIAAGHVHGDPQGQGMFVFILALAAAEVAIGLSIYRRLARVPGATDSDALRDLQG